MIFKITENTLSPVSHDPKFSEVEIENIIVPSKELEPFPYHIFNEDLLYVCNQKTLKSVFKGDSSNGRLDVLAIDKQGSGIVIEIKKDQGRLGMETQALFYLSSISPFEGLNFIRMALSRNPSEQEVALIEDFINGPIETVNKHSRLILLARFYNSAVFSLGNWLNNSNCSFKAIRYHVASINNEHYIQFSTEFEATSKDQFGLSALKNTSSIIHREKASVFWHNIGIANQDWWDHLISKQKITASYDNLQNDNNCRGYQIMHQYVEGDTVFAFAGGFGVVGYGKITKKPGYQYQAHSLTKYQGRHSHCHSISWTRTVPLDQAVPASYLKEIGLNHPTQTKQEIRQNQSACTQLIEELNKKSNQKKTA